MESLLGKAEVVLDSVAGSEAKTGLTATIRSHGRDERAAGRALRMNSRNTPKWNGDASADRGLGGLEQHLGSQSNRVALALVTLGLYIAASLLMQHSIGPHFGGMPVLGIAGYTLAFWFTWRLARGISRSGRL